MNCQVNTFLKTLIYENLQSVTLPGFWGELEILPGHAEIFALLNKGRLVLEKKDGKINNLEIEKGACHFKDNFLVIIL